MTASTFRRLFGGGRFWALIVIIIIAGWKAIISYDDAISIYLSVSLKSQHDGIAALYYDVGDGYSENHVISMSIIGDNQAHDYLYKMPGKTIYRLRWDPPNITHDTITISKIEILDGSLRPVERLSVRHLQPLNQIQAFDVAGEQVDVRVLEGADDPQISISLDSPIVVEKINPFIRFLSRALFEFLLLFFGACLLMYLYFRWKDSDNVGDWFLILIVILMTVVYFSIPVIATWDTAHYHNYLDILYGKRSWADWDVIRGPVFPVLIACVHLIFGYNSIGMLLFSYLVTLLVLLISIYFIRELTSGISDVIRYSLLWIVVFLNPVFLGFYHTILTEYVASFLTIFSVYISYLWVNKNFYDRTRAKFILLSLIFIMIILVSFHLKQPYIGATVSPLIGTSLFSIYFNRKIQNIIQRFAVIIISIVLLISSVIAWHHFLPDTGVASKKERMSYYLVSDRLYRGLHAQLPEDMKKAQGEPLVHDVIVNGISLSELSSTDIEKDQTINYIDKKRALRMKAAGGDESYGLLFIANADGRVIDKILVGGKPGIWRSLFELVRIFIAHPILSIKKYAGNYFEMTRLTKNLWMETEGIAFRSYEAKGFGNNVYLVMPSYESLISPYKQYEINPVGYFPYRVFKNFALFIFPWLLNGLGAIWILFTLYILYLSVKKRITKKVHEVKYNNMFVFLFISSFTIFSQIVFPHALLGATNDRYAFPAYSLSLIVFVIILLQCIAQISKYLRKSARSSEA